MPTTLVETAEKILHSLPLQARFMGLDLGTKTIGIATSDLTRQIATPRETLIRRKFSIDVKYVIDLAAKEGIGLYVLGLPLNMDGSEGPRAQSTRSFARNFSHLTKTPIIFWDERWSTAAVQRTMLEADMSRKKRSENVDKLAAAYILQNFLDTLC